ncbi:unnamed protein product [Vitrella brassicaformis CCMP3155]|uniref:Rab-GAP TBC domain-containing protein n=6 Tax=Vitrella brassicaformis TaxID=1169539 RepID=A0A0G4ECJ0_VITBC|nr:unnamed protein product [Vitrella brassicaformis CCMP3155]|eukprot:CEL93259.1 unnamed protein product [Vitrella brassicaformis CCMP3155]
MGCNCSSAARAHEPTRDGSPPLGRASAVSRPVHVGGSPHGLHTPSDTPTQGGPLAVTAPKPRPFLYQPSEREFLESLRPEEKTHRKLLRRWFNMLQDGEFAEYFADHPDNFRKRLRKGPPARFRWLSWKAAVGYGDSYKVGKYEELASRANPENDPKIQLDLKRTFPEGEGSLFFKDPAGQAALRRLLVAYANHNPGIGYVQGMNFIAGYLLLMAHTHKLDAALSPSTATRTSTHPSVPDLTSPPSHGQAPQGGTTNSPNSLFSSVGMGGSSRQGGSPPSNAWVGGGGGGAGERGPSCRGPMGGGQMTKEGLRELERKAEEEAFWVFVRIMDAETYGASRFFEEGLYGIKLFMHQFDALVRQKLPILARHLEDNDAHVEVYAMQWFISLFLYSFPFECVGRLWDWMLSEGLESMHHIGLAILKLLRNRLMNARDVECVRLLKFARQNVYEMGNSDDKLLAPEAILGTTAKVKIQADYLAKLEEEWRRNNLVIPINEDKNTPTQRARGRPSSQFLMVEDFDTLESDVSPPNGRRNRPGLGSPDSASSRDSVVRSVPQSPRSEFHRRQRRRDDDVPSRPRSEAGVIERRVSSEQQLCRKTSIKGRNGDLSTSKGPALAWEAESPSTSSHRLPFCPSVDNSPSGRGRTSGEFFENTPVTPLPPTQRADSREDVKRAASSADKGLTQPSPSPELSPAARPTTFQPPVESHTTSAAQDAAVEGSPRPLTLPRLTSERGRRSGTGTGTSSSASIDRQPPLASLAGGLPSPVMHAPPRFLLSEGSVAGGMSGWRGTSGGRQTSASTTRGSSKRRSRSVGREGDTSTIATRRPPKQSEDRIRSLTVQESTGDSYDSYAMPLIHRDTHLVDAADLRRRGSSDKDLLDHLTEDPRLPPPPPPPIPIPAMEPTHPTMRGCEGLHGFESSRSDPDVIRHGGGKMEGKRKTAEGMLSLDAGAKWRQHIQEEDEDDWDAPEEGPSQRSPSPRHLEPEDPLDQLQAAFATPSPSATDGPLHRAWLGLAARDRESPRHTHLRPPQPPVSSRDIEASGESDDLHESSTDGNSELAVGHEPPLVMMQPPGWGRGGSPGEDPMVPWGQRVREPSEVKREGNGDDMRQPVDSRNDAPDTISYTSTEIDRRAGAPREAVLPPDELDHLFSSPMRLVGQLLQPDRPNDPEDQSSIHDHPSSLPESRDDIPHAITSPSGRSDDHRAAHVPSDASQSVVMLRPSPRENGAAGGRSGRLVPGLGGGGGRQVSENSESSIRSNQTDGWSKKTPSASDDGEGLLVVEAGNVRRRSSDGDHVVRLTRAGLPLPVPTVLKVRLAYDARERERGRSDGSHLSEGPPSKGLSPCVSVSAVSGISLTQSPLVSEPLAPSFSLRASRLPMRQSSGSSQRRAASVSLIPVLSH